MSDEEFEGFLDRVYHLCNHVFMGELNDEVLGLLFKGCITIVTCLVPSGKPRCVDVTSVSFSKNGNVTAIRCLLCETEAVSSLMPIFRPYSETVAAVACGTCRFLKRG